MAVINRVSAHAPANAKNRLYLSTVTISGLMFLLLKDCKAPSNITSTQLNRNTDIRNSKKLETGPSAALEKMGAVECRNVSTK